MNLKQLHSEWKNKVQSVPTAMDAKLNDYLSCYVNNVADIKVSSDYNDKQKYFKAYTEYYNEGVAQHFYAHLKPELLEKYNAMQKRNLKTLVEWCLSNNVVVLSKFSKKSKILYFTIVERSIYNLQFNTVYKYFRQEKLTYNI